jgi:hypothetical protein
MAKTYSEKTMDFPTKSELKEALPIEFKILIPSTRDKSIPISEAAFRKRVDEAVQFLTKRFGGSTITIETGTYMLKGKTIMEKIASIQVNTNQVVYNKYDEDVEKYVLAKKHSWGQDSMGFMYQNKLLFI